MKHWQELAHISGRVVRLGQDARPDQSPAVAAVALVTRIVGSAYRRPGAKLLIDGGGGMFGGVSGGCLEEDVRRVGLQVLEGGRSRLLHYDTGEDDRQVWGLGLGCNGQVDLVVHPISPQAVALFGRVQSHLAGDLPFALATVVEEEGSGGFVLVGEGGLLGSTLDAAVATAEVEAIARAALQARRSGLQARGAGQVFTEVLVPPPTLLVCGAGDDARPLVSFAAAVGFRVVVADHRSGYLTEPRFPEAHRLVRVRAEQARAELPLAGETYAVVKTHSFEHDRNWLGWLLTTDPAAVPYLGLLGPRARSEKILGELGAGRDRVFGPVGLDLGADGPEQIALSVVSEVLAVWSGRDARHLRDRACGAAELASARSFAGGAEPSEGSANNAKLLSMPAPDAIAGVVLAAGTSSRMGQNKLLLELAGQTLVRQAVRAAIEGGLDPVIVVLGHEEERVRAELHGLACEPLSNPGYAEGQRSSLQAGVTRASAVARALVVVLADMPFVTASMIAAVLERYRATGAPLVVSRYGDVDAPPILYDRSLFGDLLAIPEDRCAKQVVRRHRDRAQELVWPVEALRDIDKAEDYQKIRAELAAPTDPPRA